MFNSFFGCFIVIFILDEAFFMARKFYMKRCPHSYRNPRTKDSIVNGMVVHIFKIRLFIRDIGLRGAWTSLWKWNWGSFAGKQINPV